MRIIFILAALALSLAVANAANFPFIRLNGKTNQISDSGTALTRDGVPIGSGGSSQWTSLSGTAVNGNEIVGLSSTNDTTFGAVIFSQSTNGIISSIRPVTSLAIGGGFTGQQIVDFSAANAFAVFIGDWIGVSQTISITNSAEIYHFGDGAGINEVIAGANNVYNYGSLAGESQTIGINENIYNFGLAAGGFQTILGNSKRNYNFGSFAGAGQTLTNSSSIFNIGDDPGDTQSMIVSHDIFTIGDAAGSNSVYDHTHDIFTYGSGMVGVHLTNSVGLVSLGHNAGNGVSGSMTNVVFIGDGSTAPDGSSDRVIVGPNMSLSVGSTNAWKLGAVKSCSGLTMVVTNYIEVVINGVTNAIPLGTITP